MSHLLKSNLLQELIEVILKLNPMQSDFLKRNLKNLSDDEKAELEAFIHFIIQKGRSIDDLAQSYDLIVKDTLREQVFFLRHGHYRHKNFQDVASSVYHNPIYMNSYMEGLALTAFFWSNHLAISRFFSNFINGLIGTDYTYFEIGPGHGNYFMKAARSGLFKHLTGIDLSSTSVAMTNSILETQDSESFSPYEIINSDFLEWDFTSSHDIIVMSEVLEHVEQPDVFLNKIHQGLNKNGSVFITTCINSPAIDHIYLYSSIDDLENQVLSCNWRIENRLVVPYTGLSLEESKEKRMPINIALILKNDVSN